MKAKEILERAMSLLVSKGQDYTSDVKTSQFENFERAALISSWFIRDEDKVYATLIGIKLARLASLLNRRVNPNHEAVDDTFVDGSNYFALWAGSKEKLSEAQYINELNALLNVPGTIFNKPEPDLKKIDEALARPAIKCQICEDEVSKDDMMVVNSYGDKMHLSCYENNKDGPDRLAKFFNGR